MINETNTNQLSEREREVLQLVASGQSNQQIANTLGISINTVKVHLRNVFSKIGVASRTEATLYAVRSGIVSIERAALPDTEDAVDPARLLADVDVSESSPAPSPIRESDPVVVDTATDSTDGMPDEARSTAEAATIPPVPVVAVPPRQQRSRQRWIAVVLALVTLAAIATMTARLIQGRAASEPSAEVVSQAEQNRWSELSGMPEPRAGFGIASVGGQVFVIGGENETGVLSSVKRYDAQYKTWSSLSEKPTPVTDVRAAVVGGKIYVPGGRTSPDPADVTDVFERYDPLTEQWETLPPLPDPRSAYALAAVEGKLYVFGGWDGSSYRDEVFEFDPDLNRWSERTSMPTARAYADAAVVEGNVYVLGGENSDQTSLSTNEVYTPAQENGQPWTRKTPLPEPRSRFGSVVTLGVIHVIGGDQVDASPVKYNVVTNTWEPFAAPHQPVGERLGVVQQDVSIMVLGGEMGENEYSPAMQAYQALSTIFLPRSNS